MAAQKDEQWVECWVQTRAEPKDDQKVDDWVE